MSWHIDQFDSTSQTQYDIGYNDGLNGYTRHPLLADNRSYQKGFAHGRTLRGGTNVTKIRVCWTTLVLILLALAWAWIATVV